MKNLLIILFFFLCACGDTIVNVYNTENTTDIDSLSISNVDTVSISNVDTLIDLSIKDTIKDTIKDSIKDSIKKELKTDTTKVEVKDFFKKELKTDTVDLSDTTYRYSISRQQIAELIQQTNFVEVLKTKLIKNVYDTTLPFYQLYNLLTPYMGEFPRDTSITVYDTISNRIFHKVYHGIVYNQVFYDTTKYRYNFVDSLGNNITIKGFKYDNGQEIYSKNLCGTVIPPTWHNIGWTDKKSFEIAKNKDGWSMFDFNDFKNIILFYDILLKKEYIFMEEKENSNKIENFSVYVLNSDENYVTGKEIKYMCKLKL